MTAAAVPPKASKANAPPAAIGSVSSVFFTGWTATLGAGFAFNLTTGATFVCVGGGAAGAAATVAAGGAARVTVRVAVRAGAGLAALVRVARVVRLTDGFAAFVVALVDLSDTGAAVL